jgi:hypothetical protein
MKWVCQGSWSVHSAMLICSLPGCVSTSRLLSLLPAPKQTSLSPGTAAHPYITGDLCWSVALLPAFSIFGPSKFITIPTIGPVCTLITDLVRLCEQPLIEHLPPHPGSLAWPVTSALRELATRSRVARCVAAYSIPVSDNQSRPKT